MRENDKPLWRLRQVQRSLQSMGADRDVGGREVARHRDLVQIGRFSLHGVLHGVAA